MSVINVHQNRAPVGGNIVYHNHKKGAFYPAFVKKSSEKNERCSTVFQARSGVEIMARQIAGTVAQRIVTYKKPGDIVEQGNHDELLAKGGFYAKLYNSQFDHSA